VDWDLLISFCISKTYLYVAEFERWALLYLSLKKISELEKCMGWVRNLAFPCSLGKPGIRTQWGSRDTNIPIPPLVVLNFQERVQNNPPHSRQRLHGQYYVPRHTPNPSDQHRVNHDTSAKRETQRSIILPEPAHPVLRCVIHTYGIYICRVVCGRMRVRTKKRKGRSRDQNNEAKDS
jgi:hypothetical protein